MKRLHIHVSVDKLEESIRFYNTLFGVDPVKTKIGLRQMVAGRSPGELRHLHAWEDQRH